MVRVFFLPRMPVPDRHQVFCMLICVFLQAGDLIAAQVISAQTFSLLFYQLHSPRWVGWVVLGLANGLMIMLTFLGSAMYKTKANGDFCGSCHFSLLIHGSELRHEQMASLDTGVGLPLSMNWLG